MGLFSSIKKGFKKLFKGIKKVFKKVMGAVGKVLGSKWGKILMMAATIFTGGMALMGGIAGWGSAAAQGAGFMGKFVSAAKGFLTALANPVDQAKKTFGAAASAGDVAAAAGHTGAAGQAVSDVAQVATGTAESAAIGAAQAGETIAAGGAKVAGEAAGGMAAGAGREAAAGMFGGHLSQAATQAAAAPAAATTAGGGWLSKAGSIAKDFIMSPTGAQVIGGMAQGAAQGAQLEAAMEHQDRIRRRWMDPNNELARMTREEGFGQVTGIQRGGVPAFGPGGQVTPGGLLPGEPAPIG